MFYYTIKYYILKLSTNLTSTVGTIALQLNPPPNDGHCESRENLTATVEPSQKSILRYFLKSLNSYSFYVKILIGAIEPIKAKNGCKSAPLNLNLFCWIYATMSKTCDIV